MLTKFLVFCQYYAYLLHTNFESKNFFTFDALNSYTKKGGWVALTHNLLVEQKMVYEDTSTVIREV